MDRIRRFVQHRPGFQLLVAEAFLRLMVLTLLVRLLPSRWICRMWTSPAPPRSKRSAHSSSEVCYAVTMAANYIPGANCLPQALVGRALLARSGYAAELRLGVAKPDGAFSAHAWLCSEGKVVLGASSTPFVELSAS